MKIGQSNDTPSPLAAPAASKSTAANAQASQVAADKTPRPAENAGVAVTLSRLARGGTEETQSSSRASSQAGGDFDAQKVKAIRAAIENGTFRINAGAIADKLLANARETLEPAAVQRR